MITDNQKVIGKYFDAKRNQWQDTANFSIHYSEEGLLIRPEKP